MPRAIVSLTGRRFGRLVVQDHIGYKQYESTRHALYRCVCDCGGTTKVEGRFLRAGLTTSCGCYNQERKTKHGHTRGNARCTVAPCEGGIWVEGDCNKQ